MLPSISMLKKRAKKMVRESKLSHNAALNRVAADHGYQSWSHLVAKTPKGRAGKILALLEPGDMLLLAARPGHGKTRLGLELAIAARSAAPAVFFTLDYGPEQVAAQLATLDCPGERAPTVDTSDEIRGDHIIGEMVRRRANFGVVDYLQILDQRRSAPTVEDQLSELAGFAKTTGAIMCFISQVDRSFDGSDATMPGISDVRQPNPFSFGHFTKACFLHNGSFRLETL